MAEMEKEAKCTDCNKHHEVQAPECETQDSFPQCSLKLKASSEVIALGGKSTETKPLSKAALRRKRKQKSKNVHLKAVTAKSHPEINTRDRSPSTQKSLKNKKQKTCNENLRDSYTAGKAVIKSKMNSSTVDKVSIQSKASLKAWPSRSYNSKKACSEVIPKQKKQRNCRLLSESVPSHKCFDFASGSTVQACCLSSGVWVSADSLNRSRIKYNRVDPRIVDQKEVQEASPKSVLVPSTSNETSGHLELPGFYFDPEKKRYFKIVPSSNNCMSNVVTRERIAFNKNEKLRQEELQSLASTGQLKDPKHQTTVRKAANILTLIDRRKQGIVTQEVSTYQLRRLCIAKLRPHAGKENNFVDSPGAIIQKMRIHAKENQLLIYYNSTEAKTSISLMKINSFRIVPNGSGSEVDRSFALDLEDCDHIFNFQSRRVSDLCFADSALTFLFCANDHLLNISSIQFNRRVVSVNSPHIPIGWDLLPLKQTEQYVMCCASTTDFGAVGTECGVFMCNYARPYQTTQLCTYNTAIHALTFANTSSKVLFCAARNGRILMYDELSSRQKPVAYLTESEGFSFDLYMTKDDRYLLSAKSNGQIEKWDLRQGRVVVDYPGHVSECARTPLAVDQREEFLSAVGSDSYTRIWDLKTGELMKVLPPPLPATKENIPSVGFVDLYGESRNNYPGLLLGMSDELHFYSL